MYLVIPANVRKYYYVVVTDINGCTCWNGYTFVSHAGVSTAGSNEISIYPNPATDKVTITSVVSVRAVITDMAGRKVMEQEDAKEVSISPLIPGMYIVNLYDEQGVMLAKSKLVKQ